MKTLLRQLPLHLTSTMVALLALLSANWTHASSTIPLSTPDHVAASAAVFRGVVVGTESSREAGDGLIYTRTSLRVVATYKGKTPTIVAVVHRGGAVGTEIERYGNAPELVHGKEYVLFVSQQTGGRLTGTQGAASAHLVERTENAPTGSSATLLAELQVLTENGPLAGADVTDQSGLATANLVSGLLVDGSGISSRFLQADRGEPIPILIDADTLPTGVTLTQATNAVIQACNAWAAVTPLRFQIEAITSFGAGADTIAATDEKLRIQLHDNYGRINSVGTLGVGGRASSSSPVGSTGWNLGGRVGTNEFYKSMRGYVVLEHGAASLQNTNSLAEVLCHEIGHALSMAHSSENPSESNNTLKQSIMYYSIHADNRGAALGAYDPPIIAQAYPSNTVPFTYSRILDITTDSPSQPNISGINEVQLRGYDLQTTNLSLQTTNPSINNGTFTVTGSTVKFSASAFFAATRLDPESGSFYDIIYARYSDGTNASPYLTVKVLSMNPDSVPSGIGDGIPDDWMTTYFGVNNTNSNRSAQSDFDGDGLKNVDEFRAGMNPTDATSAQRITAITKTNLSFQAKAYELYEIEASTNLTTWTRFGNPVVPTTSTGTLSLATTNTYRFFRVLKVP